ncbi:LytR C-terminal domain-containing protein [Schaalia sp. lx-100]|uniref:LytR C-terminal domain-containing protein n=1 Tax=Schaalia sp. lx-100 TaxID=2899081 RepID=UPI001E54BBBE|nr:LytR C-terminal domain-containing protein [Schaalia sp. lx-100]
MSSQYPKDEFDYAGEDMPVGIHRPRPSKWRSVWPFLAILVLAPLLGWGVSTLLTSRGVIAQNNGTTATVEQPVQTQSAQSTQTSQTAQSANAAQSAQSAQSVASRAETQQSEPASGSQSASAPAPIRKDARISVLNGTGRNGLAAAKAEQLRGEGFTNTSAGNADNWAATVTTVYYKDSAMESTAREIANVLGITEVHAGNIGEPDIAVLLR